MVAKLILSGFTNNKNITLKEAQQYLVNGHKPEEIPWIIRLLENPASIVALPGKITLYNHDCLHILLEQELTLTGEAFVIGFTMGNDLKTNWFHLLIYKFFSRFIYPRDYRFNPTHLKVFDRAILYGRKVTTKNINEIDFQKYENKTLYELRSILGIKLQEIPQFKE